MNINELIIHHPVCITAQATLVQAARHMKILDVGMLPVCDDHGLLVGVVTDRDIVVRGVAQEIDPKTATVRSIMTEEAVWCFEDQDVEYAAKLMESWQIRRLPVVNRQKRLVGIIALSDLVAQPELVVEVLEQISAPPALV